MVSSTSRTRADLAAEYTDETWRERFLDLRTLVDILTHSIIGADFRLIAFQGVGGV